MSIVASKDKEGNVNVILCGKITREPELKMNVNKPNLDKYRFSMSYGKKLYMDCDAWKNSPAGDLVACLETGDNVMLMGTYREWTYEGRTYKSVTVDGVFPMGGFPAVENPAPMPSAEEVAAAGQFEEIEDDYGDDDLPF
jgi:single-stranded DNA-binding protein